MVQEASQFNESIRNVGPCDWVIGFTHRGKTQSVLKAMELSRQKGAFTGLIVGQGAEVPDHAAQMIVQAGPQESIEPHTTALTSALVALIAVAGESSLLAEVETLANQIESEGVVVPELKAPSADALILAQGIGFPLASEWALKNLELGGTWVHALPSESFFHGLAREWKRLGRTLYWLKSDSDPRAQDITSQFETQVLELHSLEGVGLLKALLQIQNLVARWHS
jgi:fructoselysine-6-P-deglycase FrlB-like protein